MKVEIEFQIGIERIQKSLAVKENPDLRQWLHTIEQAPTIEKAISYLLDPQLHTLMRAQPGNRQWVSRFEIELPVRVDVQKARFSTWYELFPRSASMQSGKHGTFKDCERLLPILSNMGFDVLYFPPIHPIGQAKRRGKNNTYPASETDVGSPWAIGAIEGGHKSIHHELGTLEDFEHLVRAAKEFNIDIALDIAFQASADHPYLKEHPDWFFWRPDKTIQHAENPPKKYEDIVPFFFECEDWKNLWHELRSVFIFWIEKGIRIFRVDNPHTKPFPFWEWLIDTIKKEYPAVIFLSEAFTRNKLMYWLSKIGFTQSYTYFAWRHTKKELTDYIIELTTTEVREYFRPNFWPNTPDILTEELVQGGETAFVIRLLLAATLSSNYGIYGPPFEMMLAEGVAGSEEYKNSEKYEVKWWDWDPKQGLRPLLTRINKIRHTHSALQETSNIQFYEISNDHILYFAKFSAEPNQSLLILINLDPYHSHVGTFKVPLHDLGISSKSTYKVIELLSGRHHIWGGDTQHINLTTDMPACIYKVQSKIRKEHDFEYFL